jgi:hypothetical protein
MSTVLKYILLLILSCNCKLIDDTTREGEKTCQSYYSKKYQCLIYTNFDKEPEFPGGPSSMARFLNSNLRYPEDLILENEIQTSITAKVILDNKGLILEILINGKNSKLSPLEKEGLRIIKLMPRWIPGQCVGKNIAVEYIFPLTSCILLESE